jgi:hypothetical protein
LNIEIDLKDEEPFILSVPKSDNKNIDVVLVHYLADYSGEIHPGEEVYEWAWLDINNLPDNLAPNIRPVLRHFGFLE